MKLNGLSKFVRDKRLDLALTQEEFGSKVGLTNATISRVEKGEVVGPKTLRALGTFFNVPTKTLRRLMYENYK